MAKYIYQYPDWTHFRWQETAINALLGEVRYLQGNLSGQMHAVGFKSKDEATLNTLAQDVVKSSEIEGEHLDMQQVRSSIARRLGMEIADRVPASRNVDGVVEMLLDATQNYQEPLTEARLFGWHASLFPNGFSGMLQIEVGRYRTGVMQIVSGAMGKERVHFEAIAPALVQSEMGTFLSWLNEIEKDTFGLPNGLDPVLKAAIAHFWFIIIHPFDDGNGRIARAITDLLLSRSEGSAYRFYSMSNQIMADRKQYYAVLQNVQHSDGDITSWLTWFFGCLKSALVQASATVKRILLKSEFWQMHENTPLNERQRILLNKMLDGIEGKMKSSKWAKMAKCSTDTALRDIKDLLEKGILQQEAQSGRSTNYSLTPPFV
jgi:Fic family protein